MNDIHFVMTNWGKWRLCVYERDHEHVRIDIKPEYGSKPPGWIPPKQTSRNDQHVFWTISEVYDRWPKRHRLSGITYYTYLQREPISQQAIEWLLGITRKNYTQGLSEVHEIMSEKIDHVSA
jgi:hypothetical protein